MLNADLKSHQGTQYQERFVYYVVLLTLNLDLKCFTMISLCFLLTTTHNVFVPFRLRALTALLMFSQLFYSPDLSLPQY